MRNLGRPARPAFVAAARPESRGYARHEGRVAHRLAGRAGLCRSVGSRGEPDVALAFPAGLVEPFALPAPAVPVGPCAGERGPSSRTRRRDSVRLALEHPRTERPPRSLRRWTPSPRSPTRVSRPPGAAPSRMNSRPGRADLDRPGRWGTRTEEAEAGRRGWARQVRAPGRRAARWSRSRRSASRRESRLGRLTE